MKHPGATQIQIATQKESASITTANGTHTGNLIAFGIPFVNRSLCCTKLDP